MEREIKLGQKVQCARRAGAFECIVVPKTKKDEAFGFQPVQAIIIGSDFSGTTVISNDAVAISSNNKRANCFVSDEKLRCNKTYQWER